jgi:hypothetical protein
MEGYKPLVFAINHALRAVHGIDVPLRQTHDLKLLVHRSDPKVMKATHNRHYSERKPDLLFVFLDDARNAFDDGDHGTWADYAFNTAGDAPKTSFAWSNALSALELRRPTRALPFPPDKYTIGPAKTILPQLAPKTVAAALREALDERMEQIAEEAKKLETRQISSTPPRTHSK